MPVLRQWYRGDGHSKAKKRYLDCTPSKSRPHEPILLLLVFNSVQILQVFLYRSIFWFNWMAQELFFRFVFVFNFLIVNYFSFLGLVIHHFCGKEYFSRTPGSYRYTNSIEIVPRFGLWPSPRGTPHFWKLDQKVRQLVNVRSDRLLGLQVAAAHLSFPFFACWPEIIPSANKKKRKDHWPMVPKVKNSPRQSSTKKSMVSNVAAVRARGRRESHKTQTRTERPLRFWDSKVCFVTNHTNVTANVCRYTIQKKKTYD